LLKREGRPVCRVSTGREGRRKGCLLCLGGEQSGAHNSLARGAHFGAPEDKKSRQPLQADGFWNVWW